MPERDWRLRISDILEAIQRIAQYTANQNYQSFRQDQKTIDAVIRNLEIIGEAANNIPESIQLQNPDVPWNEMRGIRNILTHEYFGVSLPIIWNTIQHDLEPLIIPLKKIHQNPD